MSQPVKLSDELVNDARIGGAMAQRSINGQVEFWARLGRALEKVSNRTQMERLQQRSTLSLSEIFRTVEEPAGRARLTAVLESGPYPRLKVHPTLARTFLREEDDGSSIAGRFNRGKFEPLTAEEAHKV